MNWFIADSHFGHANIIRYCNRPFHNINEMDTTMLNNINEVVKEDDVLWHLGDFAYGRDATINHIKWTRRQIRCKNIHLIAGNHDKLIFNNRPLRSLFTGLWNYYIGEIEGYNFLLLHRPPYFVPSWENSLYAKIIKKNSNTIMLHGHTHNNHHTGPHNICVENRNYKPVSLQEIIEGVSTCEI